MTRVTCFLATLTAVVVQTASQAYGPQNPSSLVLDQYRDSHSVPLNMTTSYGTPVANAISSLTVGPRGPILLQDTFLIEGLQHSIREKIVERSDHAKGAGAFGYFEVTSTEITQYTRANLFSRLGQRTPLVARFSQVTGGSGSSDTVRDARGFAVKFYTNEGIWDLVTLSLPAFPIRDPMRFLSMTHATRASPVTHLTDVNAAVDFLGRTPEAIFSTIAGFTSSGIPATYRNMRAYGLNTFSLYTEQGDFVFCRFHLRPNQGELGLDPTRAAQLAGTDPDYYIRDLYNSVASGNFPSWNFSIQVMTPSQAESFRWNPFDPTKVWPESEYPPITVGQVVLNRNPRNYFTDVEQAAYNPGRVVPGIGFSPDRILQARTFIYADAQMYRLGVNHNLLPVNAPLQTVANRQRDGFDRYGDNQDGAPNYYPNSFNGPVPVPSFAPPGYNISGIVGRFNNMDEDNFSQAGTYWRSLSQDDQNTVVNLAARTLLAAERSLRDRPLAHLTSVDRSLGDQVRATMASLLNTS